MSSIFLSYDHDDMSLARGLAGALEKAGHVVWWDRHIKGGSEYARAIEDALLSADVVMVIWSKESVESPWVRDEAASGRDRGRLVPVSIDKTMPPLGFRQYHAIGLTSARPRAGSAELRALLEAVDAAAAGAPSDDDNAQPPPAAARGFDRRLMLGGGLAAAALAGGAGFFLWSRRKPKTSPQVQALFDQAWLAWTQGNADSMNQAIGLYRRTTEMAPDNPDTWGFLGIAYCDYAKSTATTAERQAVYQRAREAGSRALELDRMNAYGRCCVAYARPTMGNWLLMEREFRRADRDQPGKVLVIYMIAMLLMRVGRMAEASSVWEAIRDAAPTANQFYHHAIALWSAGQIDKAERLLDEARQIYRTHPRIWNARFELLLFGGQPGAALALIEEVQGGPTPMSPADFALRSAITKALASRTAQDAEAARDIMMPRARVHAGMAASVLQYCCALGLLDEAFAIADDLYFSKTAAIPNLPPQEGRPVEASLDHRETRLLFYPSTRLMRADPRFGPLVDGIGLTRYWREAKVEPDYSKA